MVEAQARMKRILAMQYKIRRNVYMTMSVDGGGEEALIKKRGGGRVSGWNIASIKRRGRDMGDL